MKFGFIALTLTSWAMLNVGAAVCSINSDTLVLSYDDAVQTFSIAEKASGNAFVVDGRIEGGSGNANKNRAWDSVFGRGERILLTQTNGSTVSLELYDRLPFALIRTDLHNSGKVETDFQKVAPVTFDVDLAKPVSELRTMGTAGLTAPEKNPGSYLFLTLADPATRRGVVAGWLTEDRGSGVIFSTVQNEKVEFKAQIDYGHLHIPVGKSAKLETLVVGLFGDSRIGEELFADAIKQNYHIKLRPHAVGYCTWYSEVGGVTDKAGGAGCSNERDLASLAAFAARELKPYGFSFVQIDDGWQDGMAINGPRRGFTHSAINGPYPKGMKPVAETIKKDGLTAGLWFLPFARNHQDPEYKDRQRWFMKRLDGKPYETEWGGTSLDITYPDVQAHLLKLARAIHNWGYNYFKMDGLWTGSVTEQIYVNDGYKDDNIGNYQPFHDPAKTSIEALRDGLKILRKGAGPDVFFSGCCASQNMRSLGGAIGLVDAMRIGPDNGFDWQDYRNEVIHFEGGGIITGPIRGNRLYFLNGRVWWNDPDPCYVRTTVKINHAQLLASWMAISGMFNLDSDWLPGLPPERLDILKRCMPSYNATSRPVDYFDTVMPRIWLATDTNHPVRRDVLGLYNWDSQTQSIGYDATRAGLDGKKPYYAFDFWSGAPLRNFKGAFQFDVPAESCRVIAVRPAEGHPVLVSTSRHVTQGMSDVVEEKWNPSSGTLTGVSEVIGNDPYELRIAGVNDDFSKWKFVSASAADGAELSSNREGNWLRIRMLAKTNRTAKWTVKFAR